MKISLTVLALILYGYISNNYGRIGVRMNGYGNINHVYKFSPANEAGLQVDDKIIECDGVKGDILVTGIEGTTAHLVILRGKTRLKVDIVRARQEVVHD